MITKVVRTNHLPKNTCKCGGALRTIQSGMFRRVKVCVACNTEVVIYVDTRRYV